MLRLSVKSICGFIKTVHAWFSRVYNAWLCLKMAQKTEVSIKLIAELS